MSGFQKADLVTVLFNHVGKIWTFIRLAISLIIICHKHKILMGLQWWQCSGTSVAPNTWTYEASSSLLSALTSTSLRFLNRIRVPSHRARAWVILRVQGWHRGGVLELPALLVVLTGAMIGSFSFTTPFWVTWRGGAFNWLFFWVLTLRRTWSAIAWVRDWSFSRTINGLDQP